MAEDSDAERTEPASARRLEQARENGDVPRSRELATFTVLMTAGAGLWMTAGNLVGKLSSVLESGLSLDREQAFNADVLIGRIAVDVGSVLLACLPLAAAIMVVALVSPLLIGGWPFPPNAFMPNFGKLNPIKGLGNMVSSNALIELLKAIAKTLLVGSVAWAVVMSQKEAVLALAVEPLGTSTAHLGHLLGVAFLTIVGALGVVAALD